MGGIRLAQKRRLSVVPVPVSWRKEEVLVSTVSTVRRVGSLLAALAMLSLVVVLPSAQADLAEHAQPASSEVQIHPENPEMTLIEVDDPSSLSRLASLGFDLDHWVEPTENDTVQSIAFTTSEERDALADLGVTIIESNPTPNRMRFAPS